jgi:chaperonin GroEL
MNDAEKIITFNEDAHRHISEAVEIMQTAVGSTYGPGGRPMLIHKKYVNPTLSTDGVTVARNIAGFGAKLHDPRVTDAAKNIYEASEKTNKTAGDGTTATVVVLGEVYKSGYKQIVAKVDPIVLRSQIFDARTQICDFVKSKAVDCDKDKLVQVATISGKDPELGKLIANLIWDIGADGAVNIEYQNAPAVEVEKVTGYSFGQGFKHLGATEVELNDPLVFVTQKRLSSRADIIPLLEVAVANNRQFVIIGDVAGGAMDTLVYAIREKKADGLVIPPIAYGADGQEYFEDIATYTNARIILDGDSFMNVDVSYCGTVKKARIGRDKAVLFGVDTITQGEAELNVKAAVEKRIKEINKEINGKEMTTSRKEVLEGRKAKLAGKVSIIKVGAATEQEREELFFRVEDAVEACKSALSMGVVAGGATTLLHASVELELPVFIREALQEPFSLLMRNAAQRAERNLDKVLEAGYGFGFDLSNMTDEPVNLIEKGVVDPAKVVIQTIQNAFSVAGGLLSAGGSITEVEDEPKNES